MKCSKCNYEMKDGELTCGLCGTILRKGRGQPVKPPPKKRSQPVRFKKACPNHPYKKIEWFCDSCKKDFCADCITIVSGRRICPGCKKKGFTTQSRFYRNEGADILSTLWIASSLILIVNYFTPMMAVQGQNTMWWSMFKTAPLNGFAFLLPSICGVLLLIMATVVSVNGLVRGIIIGLIGLGAWIFYYVAGTMSAGPLASSPKMVGPANTIESIIPLMSLMLMLTASRLRKDYYKSSLARFLGGIMGCIFLISLFILLSEDFSISTITIMANISVDPKDFSGLLNIHWVISTICLAGLIIASLLAVINFGQMAASKAIAKYSFGIGLTSLILLSAWVLLATGIIFTGTSGAGLNWELFLVYRIFFIYGTVVLMFGSGNYDWLKHVAPMN